VTPDSLYNVAALLLHHGLIDLNILYAHVSDMRAATPVYKTESLLALCSRVVIDFFDKASQEMSVW